MLPHCNILVSSDTKMFPYLNSTNTKFTFKRVENVYIHHEPGMTYTAIRKASVTSASLSSSHFVSNWQELLTS